MAKQKTTSRDRKKNDSIFYFLICELNYKMNSRSGEFYDLEAEMNSISVRTHKPGSFRVNSGWVYIADPTTPYPHYPPVQMKGLKQGLWNVLVRVSLDSKDFSLTVRELTVRSGDAHFSERLIWCYQGTYPASGHPGIIVGEHFAPSDNEWSSRIYHQVYRARLQTTVLTDGVFSQTDWCVGAYSIYAAYNAHLDFVAIRVSLL
jgi:hypothetical protein